MQAKGSIFLLMLYLLYYIYLYQPMHQFKQKVNIIQLHIQDEQVIHYSAAYKWFYKTVAECTHSSPRVITQLYALHYFTMKIIIAPCNCLGVKHHVLLTTPLSLPPEGWAS